MLLLIATLAWRCVWGIRNYRKVELTGALVAVIVPFPPATNIIFQFGFVVAERTLFLSSMGSCYLVAHGAIRAKLKIPFVSLCILFKIRYMYSILSLIGTLFSIPSKPFLILKTLVNSNYG